MLILLSALILLSGCALVIGTAVAGYLKAEAVFDRPEDRAIISIWIGIVILANSFLGLSLFNRLSPPVTLGATILLTTLALLPRHTRLFLSRLASASGFDTSCGIMAIGLGVAAYCSQVIVWYDSGLYHLQFIKWLSDIGIVPGMALIHWRLGIASSWFALAAPFNQGILAGRMFTLAGGFCLLMLLLQGGIAVIHLTKQQGRRQDLFMLCSTLLTLPILLIWGMPNSTSTDLPVICMEIVTAWAILAITDAPEESELGAIRHISLALLILAAGATSMKLSAAPLLAISALFYLLHRGFTPWKAMTSFGITGLLLAPLSAAGLSISGCAFFPSALFCLDAPWALGKAEVAAKSRIIREWARWGGAPPPADASDWNWIGQWMRTEKIGAALILLTLVSAVIIFCSPRQRQTSPGTLPVIAIGLSGIAFMVCTAPSWRFGLGYLALLPALALALFGKGAIQAPLNSRAAMLARSPGLLGLLAGSVIALHSHLLPRPSYRQLDSYLVDNPGISCDRPHFNLLLPPAALNIAYEIDATTGKVSFARNRLLTEHAEDFTYFRPETAETSWDSPLPSTPYPLDAVALRDRHRGIGGGFIRPSAATGGR